MLCVSVVNLPDLPIDSVVEVDPSNEQIEGFLRVGYLRPIEHQPMDSAAKKGTSKEGKE
jgi:hypothetical protein